MKRIPVNECPAGPELNAAVIKARGWATENFWPVYDITAAWSLFEEAKKKEGAFWPDFCLELEEIAGSSLEVLRCLAPDTITRAYLKAKGVEYVEVEDD